MKYIENTVSNQETFELIGSLVFFTKLKDHCCLLESDG